ncbi:CxC2 domain-containing protein [Mycena kentingensis (nom. inval.)]|nr:CxC2 domain-containing protein [Mycena kentingensis (nom. inval.)]
MSDRKRKRPENAQPVASTSQHHSFDLATFLPPAADAPIITRVNRVSNDNRRVYTDTVSVAPPSPVKRLRAEAHRPADAPPYLPLVDESEQYGMDSFDEEDSDSRSAAAPPRSPATSGPCDGCLDERPSRLIPAHAAVAGWTGLGAGALECFNAPLTCAKCCAKLHEYNPLHWVERWNGAYFTRTSLRACGLRIQLGHEDHTTCARPRRGRGDFVVLHANGIHEVALDFCGCYHSKDVDHQQLLKAGYYPATLDAPRTCATFSCLDLFQALSLHGKTTAYDFYSTLEALTNAVGIKPPDRYRVFLRVARQWRHLHLLKRAGRGHDKYGVVGTGQGELAIRCPACPRPGVNLPDNWAEASPEDRCLYTMVIALDACFRLKRRLFSSWARDPGLGTGWAYMVEARAYEEYIASVGDQKEVRFFFAARVIDERSFQMSSCSGLAALDHANDKFSRGYAATGVAMGICARHEFVLPTAVADLQKGERYANIDWIFMSLLRHLMALSWIIVSYDIACQWSKNLKERLAALPPLVRLQAIQALLAAMRFAIPKMHVKGHIMACQLVFAFWLIFGTSTRVSGPGSRADQLDDHLGFWNWGKLIRIASLLRRRLNKARSELARQEADLSEFSKHQADDVEKWKADVDAFEADPSQPNPYVVEVVGMTEREVRNRFEEEEAVAEAAGRVRLHDVGPAEFLELVLRVEQDQRRVHSLASLKRAKTTATKINLRRHCWRLNKSIVRIRVLQATYMPAALTYLNGLRISSETPAELVPILPPSALPESARSGGGCVEGLADLERDLRDAGCRSALAGLRNQLHIKARFLVYKKVHSRHQGANTRSRALVARNENKILLHSDKYQASRRALVALAGNRSEGLAWPALLKEDIRCMDGDGGAFEPQEARDDVFVPSASGPRTGNTTREGETRRIVSWIWKFTESSGTDGELRAALKVEWSKAYARTRRWREERAGSVDVGATDTALAEGLIAYAAKQADVYRGLVRRAEGVRTAPALKRGRARPRDVEVDDPLLVGSAERAGEDTDEDGSGDDAEIHPGEVIDEFVDELGNASDEEDEDEDVREQDEEFILDGDAFD